VSLGGLSGLVRVGGLLSAAGGHGGDGRSGGGAGLLTLGLHFLGPFGSPSHTEKVGLP
jgi:hypothetical protein